MSQRSADAIIARLAARHRGRVARRDLLAAGVTSDAIKARIRSGRLYPVLPGVYAVGHAAGGPKERLSGAWLFGGPSSSLSGRGAAAFWEFGRYRQIDLSAPTWRRGTAEICFHEADLACDEWMWREQMRVTTPARTLLDLAAILPPPLLQRAFTEAEVLQRIDQQAIARMLEAHPRARGSVELRRLAGLDAGIVRCGAVRSPLEVRYRAFLERTDLDLAEFNVLVGLGDRRYEIDAFHRAARVAIELDGRGPHDVGERFYSDRERDRRLSAAGFRPVRLTDRDFADPAALYEDLVALVGRRARRAA